MTVALPRQGHHASLAWDGVIQPNQKSRRFCGTFKPPAAFWTSSILETGGTAWSAWVTNISSLSLPDGLFEFAVVGRPNLLVLRNDDDLRRAVEAAGFVVGDNLVDAFLEPTVRLGFWQKVFDTYDAVHLPADFDEDSWLSGWDCESTAWFRPSADLHLIEKRPFELIKPSLAP